MILQFGFSPCPNDTFMFEALINEKITPADIEIKSYIADVEALNTLAFKQQLEITKMSFATFAKVSKFYRLLNAGSAMGNNNGPLLIAREEMNIDKLKEITIAIPGENTTANLLLSILVPDAKHKQVFLFSEIENAVLSGSVDAGLIIHESRFTYQDKGLKKIADLGELWQEETQLPLPLGCIAVRKDVPDNLQLIIDHIIADSVKYAFDHPEGGWDYIRHYATELDDEVIKKHIDLYVNNYSFDMGEKGRHAVNTLLNEMYMNNVIMEIDKDIFLKSK